nr:hypothetical protein [uncultured Caproiciproducens sp.]
MRALESMLSKMKATKIYSLSGDTTVDFELQAYALGIDLVYDELAELEKESFIPTASDYGLVNSESLLQIGATGNVEERKNAVLKRCAITPNNFTKTDMEQIFIMEEVNATLCENIAEKYIYVNCMDASPTGAAAKSILKAAKLYLPAHLNAELDFRSISWNNIDGANKTFDTKDGSGFTWDAIDNYGNAVMQI